MGLINFLIMGVQCGNITIPERIASIIHLVYNGILIGVPLILIIVGMFDMGKAITQQKEDEIKKAQTLLVKKAIAAGLVFLMFSLVSLVFSVVSGDEAGTDTWTCIDNLIHGKTSEISSINSCSGTCENNGQWASVDGNCVCYHG